MSKTPRTDEKEFKLYDESLSRPCSVVRSSFGRQLETELADKDKQLAEAQAEIECKDELIEQMREVLQLLVNAAGCGRISAGYIRQAKVALAAERGE